MPYGDCEHLEVEPSELSTPAGTMKTILQLTTEFDDLLKEGAFEHSAVNELAASPSSLPQGTQELAVSGFIVTEPCGKKLHNDSVTSTRFEQPTEVKHDIPAIVREDLDLDASCGEDLVGLSSRFEESKRDLPIGSGLLNEGPPLLY